MKIAYINSILFLLLSVICCTGQADFRDSFVGEYACTWKQTINSNVTYNNTIITVIKHPDSTNRLIITGGNIGGYDNFKIFSDSSFTNTLFPLQIYGQFFPNDSIYIYHWGISSQNYYNEYYGRKIPLSTHEEELRDVRSYYDAVSQCLVVLPEGTGHYDLLVTDMTGRLILRETVSGAAQKNMAGFPAGIYAVTVGRAGKYMTRKIVKY